MKRLLITFFAFILFLPMSAVAQEIGEVADNSLAGSIKKENEIWDLRWFYSFPEGSPELKLTLIKLDEQGNYHANLSGISAKMVIKTTQDKFTGEMLLRSDVVVFEGSIVRGLVQARWHGLHSGHKGTIVGKIINVVK